VQTSRRSATVLIVAAGWTFFVWIVAVKNLVINHHTAGFRVVHGILAAISLGLGAAVGLIGLRARRAAQVPGDTAPLAQ
jgi:hypothetical protein